MRIQLFFWLILPFSIFYEETSGQSSGIIFTHTYIDFPFEPATNGVGGFTVNDFDSDGAMDISIQSDKSGEVFWYRNQGGGTWQRFVIATDIHRQLGATTLDVNADGHPDIVMGTYWLENPGRLNEKPDSIWRKHKYNGAMSEFENHDIVSADITSDGKAEIIAYCQNYKNKNGIIRVYNLKDPYHWNYYDIDTLVNQREIPFWNNGIHGGFAPGGIGDLNDDGYNDLVLPSGWYENPGKTEGEPWLLHRWKQYGISVGIPHTLYGTSIRSVIYDFNNDGNNDIVYTDCDGENSRAYIIFNINQGSNFILTPLPFPEGPSGSLHSLGIADFNGDGLIDIFSGEQEDDDRGMKPLGMAERGFVWVNTGTANYPKFENIIIHTDNPGWHDTILQDMDNDGDTDLVTKVWNADLREDGSRKWHISLWRNDSKRH